MEDFWGEISSIAKDTAKGIAQDAGSYLKSKGGSLLVKNGPKPTGNLSAAEIEAGLRGGGVDLRSSDQDPASLARAGGLSISSGPGMYIALGIAALGIVFLLRRR